MVVRLQLVLGSFVPAGGHRPAGSSPTSVRSYPSRVPSANPLVTAGSSGSLLAEASWGGNFQGVAVVNSPRLPTAAAGFAPGSLVPSDARAGAELVPDEEVSGEARVGLPAAGTLAGAAGEACGSGGAGIAVTAGTGGVASAEVSHGRVTGASTSAASEHGSAAGATEMPTPPATPRQSPAAHQPASADKRPDSDRKREEPPRRRTALLKVKVKLRSGPMWTVVREHTTRAIRWPSVRHWEELLILEPDTLEDVIQLQVGGQKRQQHTHETPKQPRAHAHSPDCRLRRPLGAARAARLAGHCGPETQPDQLPFAPVALFLLL
eukprot:scaffold971_cov107-Isochrysis_galbana.AAC.2